MDILAGLNSFVQGTESVVTEAVTGTPSAYDMEQIAQAHTADTIQAGGTAQQAATENAQIAQMTAQNFPSDVPSLPSMSKWILYAAIAVGAYFVISEL